jgi:hypothetical protein
MIRALRNLLRRPALRFGLDHDKRGRFRDPRFVSFLSETNRRALNTDMQDAVLRGRKFLKQTLFALAAAGVVWILVESVKALPIF